MGRVGRVGRVRTVRKHRAAIGRRRGVARNVRGHPAARLTQTYHLAHAGAVLLLPPGGPFVGTSPSLQPLDEHGVGSHGRAAEGLQRAVGVRVVPGARLRRRRELDEHGVGRCPRALEQLGRAADSDVPTAELGAVTAPIASTAAPPHRRTVP